MDAPSEAPATAAVSVDDLKKCRLRTLFHMRGAGFSQWGFTCVEHPRLTAIDHYDRRAGTTTRRWLVDEIEVANLAAAAAALSKAPQP